MLFHVKQHLFYSQTKREERNQLVGSISERVPGSWGKLR